MAIIYFDEFVFILGYSDDFLKNFKLIENINEKDNRLKDWIH